MKTKDLVLVSLFAAMMCLFSIIRIPLPTPVSFTLQIFGVAISASLLGPYLRAMAFIIFESCAYTIMKQITYERGSICIKKGFTL